jgi:hypothetical protein
MAFDPDDILPLQRGIEQIQARNTNIGEAVQRLAENMINPPGLRWLQAEFARTQSALDSFARMQGSLLHLDTAKDISKIFADRHLLQMPPDYLGGLKNIMPVADLSASIAKSLLLHESPLTALRRSADILNGLRIPDFANEIRQLSEMSSLAETLMGSMRAHAGFADLLDVHDVTRSLVGYETARLNRAHAGFSASLQHRPQWLSSAPEFVRTVPGGVVFTHAQFIRSVTTHEESEHGNAADDIWSAVQADTMACIEEVLPQLNPKLLEAWVAACDAAKRRGPDWVRHSAASIRFLLIDALTAVAPPDKINKGELPKQYLQDGQILRLGQIHWLCKPLGNRAYAKVVRADLDSAMTIVSLMNEAVHEAESEDLEEAFGTMAVRVAVALSHLLKIWKARG